jgi:uncharacterized membrane protein
MKLLTIGPEPRRWYHIILWWELRRLPYNLIMAVVGLLSMAIMHVTIPLIYMVMAVSLNVLYTSGWLLELLVRSVVQRPAWQLRVAPIAWVVYLVLSALVPLSFTASLLISYLLR